MLRRSGKSGSKNEKADPNTKASRLCRLLVRGRLIVLYAALMVAVSASAVWAAPPHKPAERKNEAVEVNAPPGQIGDSGYVVPIPEIKMRSIIGNKHPAPPPVQEPEPPASEEPSSATIPAEQIQPKEMPKPVPHSPGPVAPQVPSGARPNAQELLRLPFDPAARTPQEPAPKADLAEPATEKEEVPPFRSPQAPEPITEAPPPKKEMLKRKAGAPSIPALLENQPARDSARHIPMESARLRGAADSDESINLEARKEAEIAPEIPSGESLPGSPATVTQPETPPKAPKETVPEPVPTPAPAPTPGPIPPPAVQSEPLPKEAVPMQPPSEPVEETALPKETVPTFEQPVPGPKEFFPSPLDQDALHSREVRDYLKQAAPILEELSLLMTRAPSLNIADYDPSDPAAPFVPKELLLKMDSMKRELQILDSKTFSIIPPSKYSKFHTVIRESIASTYQACDAILAYFKESNPENLQKVLTSLTKARELIRRTRATES